MEYITDNPQSTLDDVRRILSEIEAKQIEIPEFIEKVLVGLRLRASIRELLKCDPGDSETLLDAFESGFGPFQHSVALDAESDDEDIDAEKLSVQCAEGAPSFNALMPQLSATRTSLTSKLDIAKKIFINDVVLPLLDKSEDGSALLNKLACRVGSMYKKALMKMAGAPPAVMEMVKACRCLTTLLDTNEVNPEFQCLVEMQQAFDGGAQSLLAELLLHIKANTLCSTLYHDILQKLPQYQAAYEKLNRHATAITKAAADDDDVFAVLTDLLADFAAIKMDTRPGATLVLVSGARRCIDELLAKSRAQPIDNNSLDAFQRMNAVLASAVGLWPKDESVASAQTWIVASINRVYAMDSASDLIDALTKIKDASGNFAIDLSGNELGEVSKVAGKAAILTEGAPEIAVVVEACDALLDKLRDHGELDDLNISLAVQLCKLACYPASLVERLGPFQHAGKIESAYSEFLALGVGPDALLDSEPGLALLARAFKEAHSPRTDWIDFGDCDLSKFIQHIKNVTMKEKTRMLTAAKGKVDSSLAEADARKFGGENGQSWHDGLDPDAAEAATRKRASESLLKQSPDWYKAKCAEVAELMKSYATKLDAFDEVPDLALQNSVSSLEAPMYLCWAEAVTLKLYASNFSLAEKKGKMRGIKKACRTKTDMSKVCTPLQRLIDNMLSLGLK